MTQAPGSVLVVLDRVDGYQRSILAGVQQGLSAVRAPLLVHRFRAWEAAPPESLVRLVVGRALRGVVLIPSVGGPADDALRRLLAGCPDVPLVAVHSLPPGPAASGVLGDNATGMRLIAEHVVARGARRVLAVRGLPRHRDSTEREEALAEHLARLGVPLRTEDVVDGAFHRETAFRAVSEALSRPGARSGPDRFDAVVAFNDRSAAGALDALTAAGLRVPHDVLLTGYDDDEEIHRLVRPTVTTVGQDVVEQGALAARLLLDLAAGGSPRIVRAPVDLRVRSSTVAGDDAPTADLSIAADLWTRLALLDATTEISRSLISSRDVDELIDKVAAALPRVGCRRAFLVLRDDGDPGAWGYLALAYADGVLRDVGAEPAFDLTAAPLPGHLGGELDHGRLVVHPLSVGAAELGYLMLDESPEVPALLGELLAIDLSRGLDALRSADRLARHADELEALVAERTRQLQAEIGMRRRAEAELLRANAELRASLHLDGLTGIANRGAFDQAVTHQWALHARSGGPLSLLMVDVDLFKAFNDRYGHLAGDEALRTVAHCLAAGVHRTGDVAARYGGEEFALVLPNTPLEGAVRVAHRVRRLVAEAAVAHLDSAAAGRLTVSIGVAGLVPTSEATPGELVELADVALYLVKRSGRDGIAVGRPGTDPVRVADE